MAYTFKDWQDAPSTATPISAASLEELEARVRGLKVVAPGNLGTAYTLDLASDQRVALVGTLDANVTITLNAVPAGAMFRLVLTQDGTGGRSVTVSDGGSQVSVPVSSWASATSIVEGVCPDGTNALLWVH